MGKKRYGLVDNEELQRKQAMDANTATFQNEQERRTLRERREAEDLATNNVELAGEDEKPKESMFKAKREEEQAKTAMDSVNSEIALATQQEAKLLQESLDKKKETEESLLALENKEKYAPKTIAQLDLANTLEESKYKAHMDKTARFDELEKKTFGYKQNAIYKGAIAMDEAFNAEKETDGTFMSAMKSLSRVVTGLKAATQSFIGGAMWEAQESGFTKAEEIEHEKLRKEIYETEKPVLEQRRAVVKENYDSILSKYNMTESEGAKTPAQYDLKESYKIALGEYDAALAEGGFWSGFVQDGVGILQIPRNIKRTVLNNKIKNGETLTEEESDLVKSYEVADEAIYGNLHPGFRYGVGKSVRQSAEFMIESIIGLKGAKTALSPLSAMSKTNKALQIGTGIAETVVGAGLMSGTYNTGMQTYNESVQVVQDENGNEQFVSTNAQKIAAANKIDGALSIKDFKISNLNKKIDAGEEDEQTELELATLLLEKEFLTQSKAELVDEKGNIVNPEVSGLRAGADALLKNTVENIAERYVGTAFDMAAPALTRPITNKLSKYTTGGKVGRALDMTATKFNRAMRRADDMIFESNNLGQMSKQLYTNIGPSKMVHSLPAEMFEEVVVQLTPTLQDDYADQLNELTGSDFYVNVAASVLAIGGGAAVIGSANHYKSMLTDPDYKAVYNDKLERIKLQKQQYHNIDNAIDDEQLAKDIAMHTTGTLYDPTSIEARTSELRNMDVADPLNRTKEERLQLAKELENKVFLNMALNSLNTGTQKQLKKVLGRMSRNKGLSEETRASAVLGMEKIDFYEDIIAANKERINSSAVINGLIQRDLNEGTITKLKEEREKLTPAFTEAVENFVENLDIPGIDSFSVQEVTEAIDNNFEDISDYVHSTMTEFIDKNINEEAVQKYLGFTKTLKDLEDANVATTLKLKYEMNPANIAEITAREIAKITQDKIESVTAENAEQTKEELEEIGQITPNITSAINSAAIDGTRTSPNREKTPTTMKGRKKEAAKRKTNRSNSPVEATTNTETSTQDVISQPTELTLDKENASTLGDNLLPVNVVTETLGEAFEKPIRNLQQANAGDVKNAISASDLFGDVSETPGSSKSAPVMDPAKNPARRKKVVANMTPAQRANLRNIEQGLASPMELDPEDEVQNEFVNNLAEGFKKILVSNPQLDFDGMIASLRSAYSGRNVEQKFNLAREAWEKATGAKMSDAQAQKVYNDNFADVTSVSEIAAAFGGTTPTSSSQKGLGQVPTSKQIKESNEEAVNPSKELDPVTNQEEEILYEENSGKRLYNGTGLKFGGVLGINYVEVDGVKVDTSEQVNEETRVFMDPRNFKEGDKVSMTFNMKYFLDPENVVTFWDNLDAPNMFIGDEKPTRRRLSAKVALTSIFKNTPELNSWDKIEEEIRKVAIAMSGAGTSEMTAENKAIITNSPLMQNELFIKLIPIGVVNKGYDTEAKSDGSQPGSILLGGLNDYYWFNNSNVALRVNKKDGQPLIAERELRIQENRENNLNARKAIIANGFIETEIEEVRDAVNNTRLLKTEKEQEQGYPDAFYSLMSQFGNSMEEFHKNAGIAYVGNQSKFIGGVNNANAQTELKIGGVTVKKEQVVNLKSLQDTDKTKIGRTLFIHKYGIDAQGRTTYMAHEVINHHPSKQEQFKAMREIVSSLPNLMVNDIKAQQRFQAVMGYPFNQKFTNTARDLAPSEVVSGGNKTGIFRQDFKSNAYTPGLFDIIPDFSQYESANAFMAALLSGEEIATIDKRQSVVQNIHTNIVFTPLVKNGETLYSSNSQPLMEFKNSDIPVIGEKVRVGKTSAEIAEENKKGLERRLAAIEKEKKEAESEVERQILEEEAKAAQALLIQARIDAATAEAARIAEEAERKKSGETPAEYVAPRDFNLADRSIIIEEVLKNVFEGIKITDKIDKRTLYASAEVEFDRLTAEMVEKGLDREADFMREMRDGIVGTNGKYEDSIKEYLDALMSLDEQEDFAVQTGENVKATGKASYEIDMTQSLGFQVKFMLGFIKDSKKQPGFAGFSPSLPLISSLSALQEILGEANNNNVKNILSVIKHKVKRNPEGLALFEEIGDKIKSFEKENPSVLKEILYKLYQPKVEMKFVMWEKGQGGNTLRVLDANVKNPLFLKRNEWVESLKASPLIDLYEGNHYTINEETYKRLDTLHKNLTLNYKKTEDILDVNRAELEEFLKLVGITLNKKTLDNIYEQRSQSDIDLGDTLLDDQAIQEIEDDIEIGDKNRSQLLGIGNNSIINVIFKNITAAKNTGEPLTFDSKEAAEEGILQFNPITTDNNQLNDLIKVDNFVEFRAARSMRIAGKTINMSQQPNSITNKLKDILRDLRASMEFVKETGELDEDQLVGVLKDFADTAITSNSFILDMARRNPKEMVDYLGSFLISLEALKEAGTESRSDMNMTELSDKDAFTTILGMFASSEGSFTDRDLDAKYDGKLKFRKGLMNFSTISDSAQLPFLKTVLLELTQANVDFENDALDDAVLDILREQLLVSDLRRISDFQNKIGFNGDATHVLSSVIAKLEKSEQGNTEEIKKATESIKAVKFENNVQYARDILARIKENVSQEAYENVENSVRNSFSDTSNIGGYDVGARWITGLPSLNGLQLPYTYQANGKAVKTTRPLIWLFENFISENPEENSKPEAINTFLEPYISEINGNINENIAHEVDKYISKDGLSGSFVEHEMVNKRGRMIFTDGKKDGYFNKKSARLVAYDYVVNTFIQQKDIQTLFAGDIAQYFTEKMNTGLKNGLPQVTYKDILNYHYFSQEDMAKRATIIPANFDPNKVTAKKLAEILEAFPELAYADEFITPGASTFEEAYQKTLPVAALKLNKMFKGVQNNLSKRLKGLVSPGNQLPNSKELPPYIQVMLNDVDSSSETLEHLTSIHHLDKLEEARPLIQKFKKLDNNYNRTAAQEISYRKLFKQLEKMIPTISAYLKTSSTDAQEYTSWRENLDQLKEQGRMTQEIYDSISKKLVAQTKNLLENKEIEDENLLTPEERVAAVMQPTKPLYSGMVFQDANGTGHNVQRYVYIKSSSFPLIPELTRMFPKLDNMRKVMDKSEEQEGTTVRMSFQSANKVGAVKNAINVSELHDIEKVNLDNVMKSSLLLDRANFYIQQDKPFKGDLNAEFGKRDEITLATQFEKIILGDGINKITEKIFPASSFDSSLLAELEIDVESDHISGRDLKKIYDSIYEKQQRILSEQLFNKLGMDSFDDIREGKVEVMEAIVKLLNKRLDSKQDKKAMELLYEVEVDGITEIVSKEDLVGLEKSGKITDAPTKAMFKFPPHLTPNSRKFESIFNSVINKNSINRKLPGFSSPVASQEGFDFKGYSKTAFKKMLKEGLVLSPKFDPAKGLQSERFEDGTLKYAQVFLANKNKIFNEETGKYEYVDMTQFVGEDNLLDFSKIPEEILSYFSFRIPTSSHQSGSIIEVVGFLPHTVGDLMVVPKDHTVQIGEDYDIDVRYVYQYNLVKDVNGNIKKLDYTDIVKPGKTNEQLREEFYEAKNEAWNRYYEIKGKIVDNQPLNEENFKKNVRNPYADLNKEKRIEIAYLQYSVDNFDNDKSMVEAFKENYEVDFIDKAFLKDKIAELKSEIYSDKLVNAVDDQMKENYKELDKFLKDEFADKSSPLSTAWINYYNSRGQRASEMMVLENNLVSMYKSVFSSPETSVRQLVTKVLSTDFSGDSAEEIDNRATKQEPFFNIYSPTTQRKVMKLGADGKMGIGVHSNAVTLNSLLQQLDEPVALVESTNSGGVPRAYNIVLGEHIFDGKLGKILDFSGRRLSEYLMESQNSSLDNQKLEIMGKRNENKETISVFSLLQLNGIEANTEPINGIDVSYASLFISQPVITRYVEDVKKLKSSTTASIGSPASKELEAATKIRAEYVKLVPKDDWLVAKDGGTLVGTLSPEAIEKYGAMATNTNLFEEIQPLGTEIKPQTAGLQLYILDTFLTLKQASEDVNNLRAILNIESQGMGISYFNVIAMKDKLLSMSDLNIKSESEFSYQDSKDTKNSLTFFQNVIGEMEVEKSPKKISALIDEGYIMVEKNDRGEVTLIKPRNHYSHKIVNAISLGYNMWNSIFPYDSPVVKAQIESVLRASKIEDGTARALELKYKVISGMKDYTYTSSRVLFGSDLNARRQELFFDNREEGNESLGSYIQKLKDSGSYADLFDVPFFQDIQITAAEKDYPTIIKYNSGDFSPLSTLRLYNNLESMVNSDKPLLPRNGKEMTEADLMKDLLMYAMLADQANGAIGFRDRLPVSLLEKYSVDKILRNRNTPEMIGLIYNGTTLTLEATLGSAVDDKGIIKNINGLSREDIEILLLQVNAVAKMNGATEDNYVMTTRGSIMLLEHNQRPIIGAFKKQYFQHNPEDVKVAYKHSNSLQSPYQVFLKENNISDAAVGRGELDSFTVKNGFEEFMSIKDENGIVYLYELYNIYKADSDNYISNYKRIPRLGTFGFNEYQANKNIETSLVSKNNTKFAPVWQNTDIVATERMEFINTFDTSEIVNSMFADKKGPYAGVITMIKQFAPNLDNIITKTGINLVGKASYQVVGGIPTITLNEKFLNRPGTTEKMVQDAIIEELLHYITTSTIGDYVTFSGITENGFTTEIKKDANGVDVVLPTPLIAMLKIYNEAVLHYMDKHGKDVLLTKVGAINSVRDAGTKSSLNLNDEAGQDAYRAMDMHEFIAGLFIKDSNFALEMAKTPYKQSGKSILARLSEAFARFLGRIMPNAKLDSISVNTASQLYYFLSDHHNSPTNKLMINAPQVRDKGSRLPEIGSKIKATEKATKTPPIRQYNPPTTKVPYKAPANRNTKKMTLFDSSDKDLKKGSVVDYNGKKYIFWNENNGKAKLVGADGKKLSTEVDKLSVTGSYATTIYNKVEYIVTDNGNIYSGATGNIVFAGESKSSKDQKSKIIAAARKGRQGPQTFATDLFSSPFEDVEPIITKSDKVIWGHPGLGKTTLREKDNSFLDFDTDYKPLVNEKYNLESGREARDAWRKENPKLWDKEMRLLWSKAMKDRKNTGKTLIVSDMIFLKENSEDFDKIITTSSKNFEMRSKERGDFNDDTVSWKNNIDKTLKNVPKSKLFSTDKYFSDIVEDVSEQRGTSNRDNVSLPKIITNVKLNC